MSAQAVGFRNARTDGLYGDVKRLVECLMRLDLALNVDGVWYDRETGKMVRENHVKCMVRNDYIEHGGHLRGKDLQKHINAVLAGTLRMTREVVNTNRTDLIRSLDVSEEFI